MKLVAYLAGADYKVRMEEDVDYGKYKEDPEKMEHELKQKLEESYGRTWHPATRRQIGIRLEKIKVKTYTRKGKAIKGYERGIKPWSDKEKELLKINFNKGYKEMQRLMPNRSVSSIKTKVLRLKLRKAT